MAVELPEEGVVIIPRRIGVGALVGGVLFLVAQVWAASALVSEMSSMKERGVAMRIRLDRLEANQDRITRLEEQVKIANERLREILTELQRRP